MATADPTTDPSTTADDVVEGELVDDHPQPEPERAELVEDDRPAPPDDDSPAELVQRTGAVGSAIADLPVIPEHTEMNALASMATTLAYAEAVPKALRRKPNDVFLVLLTARDTGVALTTAMREFHVIEGTVTLSPKVKLAMVRQSGQGRLWRAPDNNAERATWYAERTDQPDHVVESTFTWEDAQLAGLVDTRCTPAQHWRNGNQSCMCKDNWKRYPQRMVSWRALGYLLDDVFPEVATGLYSPDELGAVTNADGEPIDVKGSEQLPGMRGPAGQAADPPASDEDRAAIGARIQALPETAREEFVAWWRNEVDVKLEALPQRQVAKVKARLDWTENQLPATDDASDDESGQDDPEEPAAPQEAPEAPADAEASQEGPGEGDEPDELPAEFSVVQWAIHSAQVRTPAQCKADFRGEGMKPPTGNDDVLRRAWAEWKLVEAAAAVLGAISLALLGVNIVDPDDVAEAYATLGGA